MECIYVCRYTLSITPQTSDQNLGKYKTCTQKKKLRIWGVEIKLIVQQKNLALQEVFSNIDHRK